MSSLEQVLERSRTVGLLGPGPIEPHIVHASGFLEAVADRPGSGGVVDLGAGGGVPSLPMLVADPAIEMVLVDASAKRCGFLVWATVELGVADRAEVWCGRAEDFGHDDARRGSFAAVVARSFGPPSSTVECAAPLLCAGGRCVISEPPRRRDWPVAGLARAGMSQLAERRGVAVFERVGDVDPELPRPAKVQRRSPLFEMNERIGG